MRSTDTAMFIGGLIGATFVAFVFILTAGQIQSSIFEEKRVYQVIYGRGGDTNRVYIAILPNPNLGHTNVFSISNLNVGVLQFTFQNKIITFNHKELINTN